MELDADKIGLAGIFGLIALKLRANYLTSNREPDWMVDTGYEPSWLEAHELCIYDLKKERFDNPSPLITRKIRQHQLTILPVGCLNLIKYRYIVFPAIAYYSVRTMNE